MKTVDKILAVLRAAKNISDPNTIHDLVTIAVEEVDGVIVQLSNADDRIAELENLLASEQAYSSGADWENERLQQENARLQQENARLQKMLPQVEMRFNSKLTKKIPVIKAFRESLSDWGLKHAKEFVELLATNNHTTALLRDFGGCPTRMGLSDVEKLVDDINRADSGVDCVAWPILDN